MTLSRIAAAAALFAIVATLISCDLESLVGGNDASAGLVTVCHPNREAWLLQCDMQLRVCNANALGRPESARNSALQQCAEDNRKCINRYLPCNPPKQCRPDNVVPNQYSCSG